MKTIEKTGGRPRSTQGWSKVTSLAKAEMSVWAERRCFGGCGRLGEASLPRLAGWALATALALAFSSTAPGAQVMLVDYGASPPTPGPTDIAQLNAYGATNPGGLNYAWDNASAPGQTFTTGGNPDGYTMTSLYLRTAGYGYNYVGPNPFALRIYSVSGNTATLTTTYNVDSFSLAAEGDWVQWTNLSVFLNPNTQYAYSFGLRGPAGSSWEALGVTNNDPYPGGSVALVPTAGGTLSQGSSNGWDAAFVISLTAVPQLPSFWTQPSSKVLHSGTTAVFSTGVGGTPPFHFQWQTNGVNLSEGGNITGSGTNTLIVSNVGVGDAGSYALVVTNSVGAVTSSIASLTILPFPAHGSFAEAVVTNHPIAYWELNDTGDPATNAPAYDFIGGRNGSYGAAGLNGFNGILGPQPADFPGFESGNLAAGFDATSQSWATIPPLNLNTNTVTITAWVYPSDVQAPDVGLFYQREGSTIAGVCFDPTGSSLAYNWHDDPGAYKFESGLAVSPGQWSLVAVSVEPTKATLYVFNADGQACAVNVLDHVPLPFDGTSYIGNDPWRLWANRIFYGIIDEVAVFNRSLSGVELAQLYNAGSGTAIPPQVTDPVPATQAIYAGRDAQPITVGALSSLPLHFQWQRDGVDLADGGNVWGTATQTLAITNTTAANAGDYTLVVTNTLGAVTSSVSSLIVGSPSSKGYEAAVLNLAPLAYYRLNETRGTTAFDYCGGFNGTYQSAAVSGVPGAQDPPFRGFETNNTAVHTIGGLANSWVSAPFGSLATNAATFTAWINPGGMQSNWCGLVMTRGDGVEGGLGYNDQQMLAYTWNHNSTFSYHSGLVIPTNQWSFVAMVIEPDQAVLYLFNTNGLLSATNAIPHTMDVFGNNWRIGDDACDDPSRTFNGAIDEVAIFTHSLMPAQIQDLYSVGADGLAVPISARLITPNQLQVTWPLGTLLEADNVIGPWTTNTATSPYTLTPSAARKFYRAVNP